MATSFLGIVSGGLAVACPAGDFATSGGLAYASTLPLVNDKFPLMSRPSPTNGMPPTGWSITYSISIPFVPGPVLSGGTATAFAVCIHVPPSITATVTKADGSQYAPGTWTNQDVIVTFACTEGGASLTPTPPSIRISTEGQNQSATASCTDAAGATATTTVSNIDIDKTPPVITASAVSGGAAYNPGTWTNKPVTVTFACTDALSGVASLTQPAMLASDGDNQSATGSCSDRAGNQSNITVSNIRIDQTPPTISMSAATNSGPYTAGTWTNQDVTVTTTCSDTLSGVVTPQTAVTVSSEGANQSVTGTCVDFAGNHASATFGPIRIDKTPPAITAVAVSNGNSYAAGSWTNHPVTVTFSCTDALSGVKAVDPPMTLVSEGGGQFAIGTCTDNAGNTAFVSFGPINIDLTPPVVTWTTDQGTFVCTGVIGSCTPALSYVQTQQVSIVCSSSDALSGVLTDGCAISGAPILGTCGTTVAFGNQSLTATTTDVAQNVTVSTLKTSCVAASTSILRSMTLNFVTKPQIAQALVTKIDQAASALARGDTNAADGALQAYRNQLRAQTGKAISVKNATTLINISLALGDSKHAANTRSVRTNRARPRMTRT